MKRKKAVRQLLLYQRLSRGETVYKSTFCMEFGVSKETFERDMKEIREFLSESFSGLELVYQKNTGFYCLKNLHLKPEMGLGECFLLAKLLLDSRPLRTDDQEMIVNILLSQLRPEMRERALRVLRRMPEIPSCLTKSSIKLIEDLLYSIECKDQVSLQFGEGFAESACVPYSVEFRARNAYLAAWELESGTAALYPLDDIQSYIPARKPYILSLREQTHLQELAAKVCNEDFHTYQPYIYSKGGKNK